MTEDLQQPALDRLRHYVFPPASFSVHVLPLQADDIDEQPFGKAVLAHDPSREPAAFVGQLQMPVAFDGEQPVASHPSHGLAHGGPGLVQPLGDPRPQRDDALLLELEDRAQVHLRGVDEVRHAGSPPVTGEESMPVIVSHHPGNTKCWRSGSDRSG